MTTLSARVAVALATLMAALFSGGIWLNGLNPPVGQPLAERVGLLLSFAACGVLGAFLAVRRPANRVGWSFLAIGVTSGLMIATMEYAHYGLLTAPGSLPLATVVAWLQTWLWFALMAGFATVLLLFPDGHPPTSRWRVVGWVLGLCLVGAIVLESLRPTWYIGQTDWGLAVPNALGLEVRPALFAAGESAVMAVASVAILLAVASIVVRYRRAGGIERLQLRWVAHGAVVALALTVAVDQLPVPPVIRGLDTASFALLPVTAAVAILRHRLYDLDRLVRRTVTYAIVLALVAGLYAVAVIVVGGLVRSVTGGADDLVVALSTLAVAAAFGPLHRRVQAGVERRFYRSRYDANRIAGEFASRLRDQVDLEALARDLGRVTVESMQPTSATVWWAPRTTGSP